MKNKIKISIGIAAYNEEKFIRRVLNDALSQTQDGWSLTEVLIYTDGCTDNTVLEANKTKSKYVKIIEDKARKGKTARLRQMFQDFNGDILVMLDADIKIKNSRLITNLLRPFIENSKVQLVGGNSMPFPPTSFFERSVYSTFDVFYESRKKFNGGNNVFGCTGSCMAITKKLADKIKLPKIFNEDAYIYLLCIQKGFEFRYVDAAIIYYQLPKNLSDYLRQVFRSEPTAVNIELNKYFGDLADKELKRPVLQYLTCILKVFTKNPLGVLYISFVNLICIPLFPIISKRYKLSWFTASSTH